MSTVRYWLTQAAEADLEEIAGYTLHTWGGDQLLDYQRRLQRRLTLLLQFPETGRNHPRLHPDFRYVVEGKHYIFYRITASGDVEVLRFLHCRAEIIEKLAAYL